MSSDIKNDKVDYIDDNDFNKDNPSEDFKNIEAQVEGGPETSRRMVSISKSSANESGSEYYN
eukprot:CAMPEP_0176358322 /NCGR_PEP_ID=MMETSP0126-20121128/15468_1 /TAXON_ID=141414 ORGANISM="Strombidinopsis acuminatum, Strain SPMC142" /NCGR_SAMPLE_ID=MMETSP0126 /ASSEMBLY_ACC=CAM_ASM_000229 /LENGTH=61 /DNA_ID=CAMNT_0017712435 /DNA_START=917 /DNA_END=1102 /DNA_ORIENTATION=+